MTYPLYPYESPKLALIFVYGTDSTREMNIVLVPESVRTLAISIGLFVILATTALCFMRRKLKLPRSGSTFTFIDVIIAFIAGGNLRMQHKFERWFFGILLIGTFFINSLFTGDLLDCVIRILNQRISTFQQLADINSPIYISKTLAMHEFNIRKMLRFVA